VDVTAESGVRFRHDAGRTGQKQLPETMGAGVALLDFDGDGDLDLFFVQSGPFPGAGAGPSRPALYRNDGGFRFTDVTEASGLCTTSYGQGVTVGDCDNDGDPDLFVTGFGRSTLWRNEGKGVFTDATDRAGIANPRWGTSAAFLDYDRDGRPDLFVANYLTYDPAKNPWCGRPEPELRAYCHPDHFTGAANALWRNQGDGTFTDVTRAAGLWTEEGKGLGVVAFDGDDDGWTDLYVANDSVRNFLFRNRGDGTFEDVTLRAGVGYSQDGRTQAGMGTEAGDLDGDGRPELVVTNLDDETNTVYRSLGDGTWEDRTWASGMGEASFPWVGWGVAFPDLDHDGDRDVYVVNGHLQDNVAKTHPERTWGQLDLVMENLGGLKLRNVAGAMGRYFTAERALSGRGLATGDLDGDGDLDLVVSHNHGPPTLLRNDGGNRRSWALFDLVGARGRDAWGARVRVEAGGRTQTAEVSGGGSYCSRGDRRLHFGLGAAERIDRLIVRWPSGPEESFTKVAARRVWVVREGAGRLEERR